jgi:phosphatidylglycerophosphate synthase
MPVLYGLPGTSRNEDEHERAVVTQLSSKADVSPAGFSAAYYRLKQAQKAGRGAPPYSLYINRPLGRVFAAAAYQVGLTPNQVTYVSAVFTFVGIGILAVAPATWLVGVVIAVLLVIGYALDSADGQLARLRGGGSLVGEWLDHMIDSVKVSALHLAVLLSFYRNFDLQPVWLLVPIGFAVVSAVHFFGMILVDLMARARRAEAGLPTPPKQGANVAKTLMKLPTDYGVFCLAILLLGWHPAFFAIYTFLAVATAGYTILVAAKWRSDVVALDAIAPR